MTDYLTKEEIRQWRSSLERITLEEFARRLGKEISNEKETNDMVDKVYKHSSEVRYISNETVSSSGAYKAERITSLAQQSFDREKELSLEKYEKELIKTINKDNQKSKSEKSLKSDKAAMKAIKAAVKAVDKIAEKKIVKKAEKTIVEPKVKKETKPAKKQTKAVKTPAKTVKASKKDIMPVSTEEIQISFKKNLTPREQAVFEHFLNNKNQIVYAKELAQVLELPRDYVYKYIKNLRAKMNENAIQNADNGGFVLTM